MGFYKYMQQNWNSEEQAKLMKERLISWRKEPAIVKLERPMRLDRAHAVGYKAKQGFIIARARIAKGTRKREKFAGGRKNKNYAFTSLPPAMSLQHIAEIRAAKHFPNLEVLNSYYLAEDGRNLWFEVVLVDPAHPCIMNDPRMKWICCQRGRAYRGLTAAGRSGRGLRGSGKGFEKRLL
ncbi:MAG: 50S ribosomal protein L15e [Candidatus Aenigmatarchaeota archaeon]